MAGCMHKHAMARGVLGHAPPSPPGKLVSEIAPEAIFGGFPSMLGYAYFC